MESVMLSEHIRQLTTFDVLGVVVGNKAKFLTTNFFKYFFMISIDTGIILLNKYNLLSEIFIVCLVWNAVVHILCIP
jgi:hypothetical protein